VLAGCKGITINHALDKSVALDPIKIDPIKLEPIDINMRVDVYQYSAEQGDSETVKKKKEVAESLRNRSEQIRELKNSELVAENHQGLLTVLKDPPEWGDGYVTKTVKAENDDRLFMMEDKARQSNSLKIDDIKREQWERRRQLAFEHEWVEVEEDGEYKVVKKGN
jgi:hypothetical protein